jgi:hypothetical protein
MKGKGWLEHTHTKWASAYAACGRSGDTRQKQF